MTAPGWYPDPSSPHRQRYFDGTAWTDRYAPMPPPPSAPKSGVPIGARILLGGIGVALFLWGAGSCGHSGSTSSTTSSRSGGSTVASSTSSWGSYTPTTTRSPYTTSQDNAIRSAQSYLSHNAFSRKGLIEQLEYEQFSTADATFAVDHIVANWNEQAVKSAKSYLSHNSFSQAELIEQLEYEGFTPSQAQYGAAMAYR